MSVKLLVEIFFYNERNEVSDETDCNSRDEADPPFGKAYAFNNSPEAADYEKADAEPLAQSAGFGIEIVEVKNKAFTASKYAEKSAEPRSNVPKVETTFNNARYDSEYDSCDEHSGCCNKRELIELEILNLFLESVHDKISPLLLSLKL